MGSWVIRKQRDCRSLHCTRKEQRKPRKEKKATTWPTVANMLETSHFQGMLVISSQKTLDSKVAPNTYKLCCNTHELWILRQPLNHPEPCFLIYKM